MIFSYDCISVHAGTYTEHVCNTTKLISWLGNECTSVSRLFCRFSRVTISQVGFHKETAHREIEGQVEVSSNNGEIRTRLLIELEN